MLNIKVHSLRKALDEAFRSDDRVALRTARINVTYGIKEAKKKNRNKRTLR